MRGFVSSMVASRCKNIAGKDLEVLDMIYHQKIVSEDELAKTFPNVDINEIISHLHRLKYIKVSK